jgi:hypothetical protein
MFASLLYKNLLDVVLNIKAEVLTKTSIFQTTFPYQGGYHTTIKQKYYSDSSIGKVQS